VTEKHTKPSGITGFERHGVSGAKIRLGTNRVKPITGTILACLFLLVIHQGETMNLKSKMYFALAVAMECCAITLIVLATPLQSSDYVSEERSDQISLPDLNKLSMVSFSTTSQGNEMRAVVVYKDPATKRPVDYIAVYNATGDLLALNWYDRFGIERMAVDRGILDNTKKAQGVFIALLTGDSL